MTELSPDKNSLTLSTGKELSYKSLVLAPGFAHESSHIDGLVDFEQGEETNNTWVHTFNNLDAHNTNRNFYNGYQSLSGDNIVYSPKFPYKGEGCDFYALYYEHMMRQDKLTVLLLRTLPSSIGPQTKRFTDSHTPIKLLSRNVQSAASRSCSVGKCFLSRQAQVEKRLQYSEMLILVRPSKRISTLHQSTHQASPTISL